MAMAVSVALNDLSHSRLSIVDTAVHISKKKKNILLSLGVLSVYVNTRTCLDNHVDQ